MTIAENFVAPIINCNEAQNAGSCILIAPLPDCKQEPDQVTIALDGAAPLDGISVSLIVLSAVDSDGVDVAALETSYKLRKDAVLHFDDGAGGYLTAKVAVATEINDAASTPVPVVNLEAAIPDASEVVVFANVCEITDATDLPINSDTQDDDRKVLKNGLQSSTVKTNISASVSLQMITNPDNKAQFAILFRASQSTEDIYVAVVKSSGYSVFGRCKVMSYNITGAINSIERVSTTLNFQAPFALAFLSIDPECNPSQEERDQLAEFARLMGLPQLTV